MPTLLKPIPDPLTLDSASYENNKHKTYVAWLHQCDYPSPTYSLTENSCRCSPVQILGGIGSGEQFYTSDMCNEICIMHQTCLEFAIGKGPELSGKCYLHNACCD